MWVLLQFRFRLITHHILLIHVFFAFFRKILCKFKLIRICNKYKLSVQFKHLEKRKHKSPSLTRRIRKTGDTNLRPIVAVATSRMMRMWGATSIFLCSNHTRLHYVALCSTSWLSPPYVKRHCSVTLICSSKIKLSHYIWSFHTSIHINTAAHNISNYCVWIL